MVLAAALIYWVIIALWLAVLATVAIAFVRNPRTFGTVRLLLAVLIIDTFRNVTENFYFGLYFGSQYGYLPSNIVSFLGQPGHLLLPKVMNVLAACAVLSLLIMRWLPMASRERAEAEADIRLTTQALSQEAEERKRLFETSLDLILITDRSGNFLRVSPSSFATIGYRPEEMVGRSGIEFIFPGDLDSTRREMRLARNGHDIQNFNARYVHKNGNVVSLAWSGVWSESEQKHFFFGRDITEQKEAEKHLRHLAHFDQLTSLPNRQSLRHDLGILLVGEQPRPVSIVIFDLDGFKDINDTLGHSTGDLLLQQVAQRMMAVAKDYRVYRLGGDEFVLVAPDCGDVTIVGGTVDQVLNEIAASFDIENHNLLIAASAGIAIAPTHGTNTDTLLASADLALYDAKAAGGGSYRLFSPVLRAKVNAKRELDRELRRACANNEFLLHYQPQYRASDAKMVGAEALLRWHHPEKGLLLPGVFLEALQDNAVVLDVGRWILNQACESAARWRDKGLPDIKIAVNLFPAQFRYGTLLNDVQSALSRSGLTASALELEITENIALSQSETMITTLSELGRKGVGLAFDDFGTGYASLSYLTKYPLTRIKIDRSFVQKINDPSSSHDAAIVRSIIAMAHNLGLQVTAEGVETYEQRQFLKAHGCHELQGFLFSRPVAPEVFESLLRSEGDFAQLASQR